MLHRFVFRSACLLALAAALAGCREKTPAERYPGPWMENVPSVMRALAINNVRDCPRIFGRVAPDTQGAYVEYLVYCGSGAGWKARLVWPGINKVSGVQEVFRDIPPPQG